MSAHFLDVCLGADAAGATGMLEVLYERSNRGAQHAADHLDVSGLERPIGRFLPVNHFHPPMPVAPAPAAQGCQIGQFAQ